MEVLAHSQEEYQEKRVNDVSVQVKMDSRTLATIASYFAKSDGAYALRSAPTLVKEALEVLRQLIVKSQVVEEFYSVSSAREYLTQLGIYNLNAGGRNKYTLTRALLTERSFLDDIGSTKLIRKRDVLDKPKSDWTPEQMMKQAAEFKERLEEEKNTLKQLRDAGMISETKEE